MSKVALPQQRRRGVKRDVELEQEVASLYRGGKNAKEIAAKLGGVKVSFVMLIVRRLGISRAKPDAQVRTGIKLRRSKKQAALKTDTGHAGASGVPMGALASDGCLWPVSPVMPLSAANVMLFCADPRDGHRSYCPRHRAVAYTKVPAGRAECTEVV